MADKAITALQEDTNPTANDVVAVVDVETGTTKKLKLENILPPGSVNKADLSAPLAAAIGDYSTNEVNTGFGWVDSRPIYKKTINFGTWPNNTTKNVAHGITGLAYVVQVQAMGYDPSANIHLPLPLVSSTSPVVLTVDGANVGVSSTSNRTVVTTSYITLFYVKAA